MVVLLILITGCSAQPAPIKKASVVIPPPIEVLHALPTTAPIPTRDVIASALAKLINSPALGKHVGVAVADAITGNMLYQNSSAASNEQFVPASSIKLFTAVAVLLKNSSEEKITFKGKALSLSNLVEITLTESDNSGADLLSTLVAEPLIPEITRFLPALDLSKTTMADASGLSRKDRTTPTTLVNLLLAIADPTHPELSPILSGLPVAGFSGTLKDRASKARGQIRAKTGTLTGVDVLTGYLVDRANRTLVFAIMADRVPKTEPGRKVIDQLATALTSLS